MSFNQLSSFYYSVTLLLSHFIHAVFLFVLFEWLSNNSLHSIVLSNTHAIKATWEPEQDPAEVSITAPNNCLPLQPCACVRAPVHERWKVPRVAQQPPSKQIVFCKGWLAGGGRFSWHNKSNFFLKSKKKKKEKDYHVCHIHPHLPSCALEIKAEIIIHPGWEPQWDFLC